MLIDQMFRIQSFNPGDHGESLTASVVLNPEHPAFEGHFPGNPILPGICTLQIAKELLEKMTGKELMLKKASSIKYLGFVNPLNEPEVHFNLVIKSEEAEIINCSATVSAGGNMVCSFKGEYGVPEVSAFHIRQ